MTSVGKLSKEPDAIPKDGSAHPARCVAEKKRTPTA